MHRAFVFSLRSVNPVELPILPFLAPRVFTKWPTFPKPRRYLKTTSVRDSPHPKPVLSGVRNRGKGNGAESLADKPTVSGAYVEDFAETFGEDETPHSSASNTRNDSSKQPVNVLSDERALSKNCPPITNHLQNKSSKPPSEYLSEDRATLETDLTSTNTIQRDASRSSSRLSELPFTDSSVPPTSTYSPPLDKDPYANNRWRRFAKNELGSRSSGEFVSTWTQKFCKVAAEIEPDVQQSANISEADTVGKVKSLGEFLLNYQGRRLSRIFKLWKACVKVDPDTIPFLLCLLRGTPSEALETLFSSRTRLLHDRFNRLKRALSQKTYDRVRKQYAADALDLIALYSHLTGSGGPAAFDTVYSEVMKALSNCQGMRELVSGMTFLTLVKNCNAEQITTLYDAVISKNINCRWPMRLRFAYFFAINGQYERTLQILKYLAHSGADVTQNNFQSISNLALRRSMLCENGYHDNPSIIADILEIGIPMNIKHYAVVMLNAVEAGDYSMALRTYDLLKGQGPITNPWVYSIMLKGCMSSLDIDMFQMLHRDILDSQILSNDFVAGSFLCAYFVLLLNKRNSNGMLVYHEMVKVFCQVFDPTPLTDLRILPFGMAETKPNVRKASPFAISVMLHAFIYAHAAGRTFDYFMLEKTYRNFRELVCEGHEIIAPVVEDSFVSNAFLHAFSKSSGHLKKCLDIMKDMTTAVPPNVIRQDTRRPIRPAPPNVYSWSILMHCFSRHGQNAAAERVLELMQKHGVEANTVTWTTLAHGYSKTQDVSGLLDALLRMDAKGVKMTDATLNALEKLNNRQGLLDSLHRAQMGISGRSATASTETRFFDDNESLPELGKRQQDEMMEEATEFKNSDQAHMLQHDHLQSAMSEVVAYSNL